MSGGIDSTGAKAVRTRLDHRHALRAGWRVAAAVVVAAVLLAGCSSARSGLGTTDSGCYLALPSAGNAVHHRGHLVGVRLESAGWLRHHAPHLYAADRRFHPPPVHVCLVAYAGTFHSDAVERPIGRPTGRLAVVELTYPASRLIATLLVRHPPLSFGHSHIGLL